MLKAYVVSYGVPALIVALNTAVSLSLSVEPNISPTIGGSKQYFLVWTAVNLTWHQRRKTNKCQKVKKRKNAL